MHLVGIGPAFFASSCPQASFLRSQINLIFLQVEIKVLGGPRLGKLPNRNNTSTLSSLENVKENY